MCNEQFMHSTLGKGNHVTVPDCICIKDYYHNPDPNGKYGPQEFLKPFLAELCQIYYFFDLLLKEEIPSNNKPNCFDLLFKDGTSKNINEKIKQIESNQ